MPCSAVFRLKRAFVSVLLSLASAYGIAPDVSRDSDDDAIRQAYRRVPKKAHLDNGRAKKKFKALQGVEAAAAAAALGSPDLSNTAHGHPDENSLGEIHFSGRT